MNQPNDNRIPRGPRVAPFYAGEIGRRGELRKRAGLPLLAMHFGQPTAGPPAAAISAAHRVLDSDAMGYWESQALRERLVRHYHETYGVTITVDQVLLTAGASAGLVATFAALFRAGDRVGVVSPGYPAYRNTLHALGLQAVELHCSRETGYKPTPAMVAAVVPPLRGLILASPANPTGTMLNAHELAIMTGACRAQGIHLISDEIYHGIAFGEPAHSALESDPGVVVINSFSKLYRMPGWRLGWMIVPPHWAENFSAILINMFLTPSTLAQHVALAAMDEPADLQHWVDVYAQNRTRLAAGLAALGIVDIAPPDGAFYLYANIGHITRDSLQFCIRAVEETGVALAPGIDFDVERGQQFVRFSFAVAPAEIDEALQRLGPWLPRYRDVTAAPPRAAGC